MSESARSCLQIQPPVDFGLRKIAELDPSRRDPSGEPIELARASVCAATTRVRYDVLFAEWSAWASDRGVNVLSLVSEPPAYDELLAEFLQVLYQDGAPKGDAGGVLSAVQDKSPRLKKQLPTSQRTVRAWDSLEPTSYELRGLWVSCKPSVPLHF